MTRQERGNPEVLHSQPHHRSRKPRHKLEEPRRNCVFCKKVASSQRYRSACAIRDIYPVTALHTLIFPRRHVHTADELSLEEICDLFQLAKRIKKRIKAHDKSVGGFNVGFNEDAAGGQTIDHVHLHIIPRRAGDVKDPTGGIRGVIPNKRRYLP